MIPRRRPSPAPSTIPCLPRGTQGMVLFLALVGAAACDRTRPMPDPSTPLWKGPAPIEGASESPGPAPVALAAPTSADAPTTGGLAAGTTPRPVGAQSVYTLEEAINRALQLNRSLLDAEDRMESAWYGIQGAEAEFELKLVPNAVGGTGGGSGGPRSTTIGGGIALEKKFATGTAISVGPTATWTSDIDDNYRSGIGGRITQPLLRGIDPESNLAGVKGAEFAWRASQRALYLARVDMVLRTAGGVYEVIRQRELVRLNEESRDRLSLAVESAKAKERLGMRDAVDRYRAEIQLKQAEDNLDAARQSLEDALDSLRITLDLPMDAALDVDARLTYDLVEMPAEAAVVLALEGRAELEQAADNIREARRAVRVAGHNVLPQLDLAFNYLRYTDEERLGDSRRYDEHQWGVSVISTSDIARTAERAALAQTKLGVKAAERAEELQRDEITRQVRRELRSLDRARKRIDNQTEQISQSQSQLNVSRLKFERGLADNFDVIDAETNLRRAQTELISAVVDYILGSYRLRAVLGTLLERPELVAPPSGRLSAED